MKVELVLEIAEDAGIAVQVIRERLVAADADEVEVSVQEQRSGFGEPITIVLAAIVVAQSGAQLVRTLREILQELNGLQQDWAQLRGVKVVTRRGAKQVSEVTPEELAEKDDGT
jgi:RNA binding exosome subunit